MARIKFFKGPVKMLAVAMGTHGATIAADLTPISYIALIVAG